MGVVVSLVALALKLPAQSQFAAGLFASSPASNYGSTGFAKGGFANPGWGVFLHSRSDIGMLPAGFQLEFRFTFQRHAFNTAALERAWNPFFESRFAVETNTRISTGAYRPVQLSLGPSYFWKLSPDWSTRFSAGVGVLFANMDEVTFAISNAAGTTFALETLATGSEPLFSWYGGVGVERSLGDSWSAGVFCDIIGGRSDIETDFDLPNAFEPTRPVLFVNTGLFLVYRLGD